jgi:hypothetical protein
LACLDLAFSYVSVTSNADSRLHRDDDEEAYEIGRKPPFPSLAIGDFAVIGERPDRVLRIVVVPRHSIVVKADEQLSLVLDQSLLGAQKPANEEHVKAEVVKLHPSPTRP